MEKVGKEGVITVAVRKFVDFTELILLAKFQLRLSKILMFSGWEHYG